MSAASQPVLSIRDLSVLFRSDGVWRPVVKSLSFEVEARETVAVVGESGSGKSVTALSVMRLLPPANSKVEGAIHLDGRDILSLTEKRMREVRGAAASMIFQEPTTSLNPVLSIGFQIEEALIYHRGVDRRAAEVEALRILERVRVPAARQRLRDYPHRFSGGMRQRVMIAMALACKPKLLIADEPTTALDVTVQAEILELIKLLQDEEGMSVVFITHDMGVVAEIADRVVVMWKGEKVEEGPAAHVLEKPQHRYTRALLAAVPRPGSMKDEPSPKPFPETELDGASTRPDVFPLTSRWSEATTLSSPNRRALLEVAHLSTRFPVRSGVFGRVTGRVHAVEDVSFSLHAGETLGLVGESGCGKSTTGRSILRLVEPSGGLVLFDGLDVRALNPEGLRKMRQQMQMVFQDPFASLNPRKSVGAAIAEPIIVHGIAPRREAPDRVADLLRKVGLTPDMAERFPHEFSGGQRQRIAIARALALGPKLIVADEAVSALDVSVKSRVVNLMMRLQAELGLAFLFISHDIAVVERVSHRIAVMFLGEIVEIGPRAAIIENPCHPYTKKLIAAVPALNPARRGIRRGVSSDEILSSMRPVGYVVQARRYIEVGPGHMVQDFSA
jgi:peptide/nickel transport system ATP-binding protein